MAEQAQEMVVDATPKKTAFMNKRSTHEDRIKKDEEELEKLKNLDVLVINALRFDPHPSHLNVDEAIEIINQINPETTYFTHISHNMGFHEDVCKKLPANVTLAYDGLVVELD